MNKAEYAEYLETPHWKKTRAGALLRAGNSCQLCNRADELHVHHRTYERLNDERPGDLTVLCKECHYHFHDGRTVKSRPRRASKPRSSKPRQIAAPKRRAALVEVIRQLEPGRYSTKQIMALAGIPAGQCGGIVARMADSDEFSYFKRAKKNRGKRKWQRVADAEDAERDLLEALDRALVNDQWQDRRVA